MKIMNIKGRATNNMKILKNSVSSLLSYGFLLVFSIISSKYVLVSYGSETNGLLSSVNQLFSYIALLEAGIGTSTISALYKPLSDGNAEGICDVLSSSRHYYRSAAKWYLLCVIIVSFIWPLVIESSISYISICSLILLQGVSCVITFWFTSTAVNYLLANGRNYINNRVHVAGTLLTYVLKILICVMRMNIVFISVSLIAVNAIKCLAYYLYLKKSCPEYFVRRMPNKSLLKQRSSFLLHEISGVIFSSTDTIIISIFCGLAEASVYAVYALVMGALRSIIGQVFNGTSYILGNGYADPDVCYEDIHDRYNAIYLCAVFATFTIAYWLILPFLSLYTAGITDADYLDNKLPLLFTMIELLSACRVVDNQLIKLSFHAKQTVVRSMIEAAINVIVSITAVQFIGIYGVLLGTIAALLYRTNDFIIYANTKILMRTPKREYALVLANFFVFIISAILRGCIRVEAHSYIQLVGIAIPISAIIALVYVAPNWMMNRFIISKIQ